jgi:3-isopropylmalate dehydrogenase
MTTYNIAVIPGDGIGPEVTREAVRCLEASARAYCVDLTFEHLGASAGLWVRTGEALPDSDLRMARDADAILLGAVGLADARHADGREVSGDVMFGLRLGLDLYAGVRPIRTFPRVKGSLRSSPEIDYVIVRENTEGIFASRAAGVNVRNVTAVDSIVMTHEGVTRIAEKAFTIAVSRAEARAATDRVSKVTCVDKSNVLASFAFFREIFTEVGLGYSDIAKDYAFVDAMALYQIQRPETFDVIVAENLLGDILSDLAAATVGGLGLSPSGDLGDERGMFQPSHGSAPDIVGRGIANPAAAILSAGMLLQWLGEQRADDTALRAGRAIDAAVAKALEKGTAWTPDLGGSASTVVAGDAVLQELKASSV